MFLSAPVEMRATQANPEQGNVLSSLEQGHKLEHFVLDRVAKFTSLCLEYGQVFVFSNHRAWQRQFVSFDSWRVLRQRREASATRKKPTRQALRGKSTRSRKIKSQVQTRRSPS